MELTEKLIDLRNRVYQLDDIDFVGVDSKKGTEGYVAIHRSCSGYDDAVLAPDLDHEKFKFVLRISQHTFKQKPERYREGFVTSFRFMVLSNRIEDLYDLALKYLEEHPQYFRTFTDEWGRVYGEKD